MTNPDHEAPSLVEVTQADRREAEAFLGFAPDQILSATHNRERNRLAQAFARHRTLSPKEVSDPTGQIERLRIMAKQRLSSEMDEEDEQNADYQGGYDWFVNESRELLASLTPSSPGVSEEVPWIVWSNEHRAFWGPNRCGYTARIEKAGRYSQADAEEICKNANYRANSTIYEGTPPEICMPAPEALSTQSVSPSSTQRGD